MRLTCFATALLIPALAFAPAQTPEPTAPTLKVYSSETIVDVTVTDAKGHPVHGLTQSDFTVLEDGHPVALSSFAEHRTDLAPAPAPSTLARQTLPPNTFTNVAPAAPANRPLNILLLDALNTPAQDQQVIIKHMLAYVGTIPPGTQMAVYRLTTRLTILQGFTTNPALIRAALTSKLATAWASPIVDPDSAGGGNIEIEGDHSAFQGQYTLSALRQIARFTSYLPGRKNLIWFSGSFPTVFPPAPDPIAFMATYCQHPGAPPSCPEPESVLYDFAADIKSATDQLARSHVAVFPIDARGLQIPDPPVRDSVTGMTNRMNLRMAEHFTMDDIADQTGGHAFYNTNGFAQSVQQAIADGSNYYTLTYVPTKGPDSRFRKITVKVARPGLQLTYRDGYYALPPNTTLSSSKVQHTIPQPTPLQLAMTHGAPSFTQVLFTVQTVRGTTEEITLAPDNQRSSPLMKPPYVRYSLTYTTDIHTLAFAKSTAGIYSADFEFIATVFDEDGEALNSTDLEVQPIVPGTTYQSMLHDGAISHQVISVPAKGNFTLRVTVHDLNTDHTGALEIPLTEPRR